MGPDPTPAPYAPMPSHAGGKVCRRCQGDIWRWSPGPCYVIAVCDGCYEVTLPPGAFLFDSGMDYMARAEELVSMLKERRAAQTSPARQIAQPTENWPRGALTACSGAANVCNESARL